MEIPSKEFQLLVLLIKISFNQVKPETAVLFIQQTNVNWDFLLSLVISHSVKLVVFDSLKKIPVGFIPKPFYEGLKESSTEQLRGNLNRIKELIFLVKEFETENIPFIPYKGVVLAHLSTNSFTKRDFNDLDFVVKEDDLPKISKLLVANNFQNYLNSEKDIKKIIKYGNELLFVKKQSHPNVLVEPHWKFFLNFLDKGITYDTLKNDLASIRIANNDVKTVSKEWEFLIMCMHHGGKDMWVKLKYICDIYGFLILQEETIDWDKVWNFGKKYNIEYLILLSISITSNVFNINIPSFFKEKVKKKSISSQKNKCLKNLYQNTSGRDNVNLISRTEFHLKNTESLFKKITIIIKGINFFILKDLGGNFYIKMLELRKNILKYQNLRNQ